jgi:hypothetical protein
MSIPFLEGDIPALQKTDLAAWYTICQYFAGFATIVATIALVAMGLINGEAKQRAERMRLTELQGEGLTRMLWTATPKLLTTEFEFRQPITVGDLQVYLHDVDAPPPEQGEPAFPVVNVVVQKNKKTVAVADLLRVHDSAVWDLGSSENLVIDGKTLSLDEAFESEGFWRACEPLQANGLAVIFVGLESYPTSDHGQGGDDLSARRARVLGEKCLDRTRGRMPYKPDTMFLGVGLGRSTTETRVGDAAEIRQRAAVIITISRRLSLDEALPITDAFAAIIKAAGINGTDLSLYTHSSEAAERLRNSVIDYKGLLPSGALLRPPGKTLH